MNKETPQEFFMLNDSMLSKKSVNNLDLTFDDLVSVKSTR